MTQIEHNLWYTPRQIVTLGFIRNAQNTIASDYRYVLRLIRSGKLHAHNSCQTDKKYFKVLGADILRYTKAIS